MIDALLVCSTTPLSPCGRGGYYDPSHETCRPYLPADPPPGYDQACSGGYYISGQLIP